MPKNSNQRNGSILFWSAETWAFLSLRLFLSLRFLTTGLGKFNSEGSYSFNNLYDGFVAGRIEAFSNSTNLPAFLFSPFLYSLAYIEILLGAALLLGVRTKHTLAVTSLTLVCLAYGLMLLGNIDGVTNVGVHLLLTAAALYFVRHNKCELLR